MNVRNLLRGLGLSFLLYSSPSTAEYYTSSRPLSFDRDDAIVAGLEVVIGCAIGGVPHFPHWSQAARQCAKGALGGIFVYGGEKAASYASTPGMGWAAQILVNGGASMRENAARDKELLEEINYTLGPFSVRFGDKPNWYIHPLGFAAAVAEVFVTESSFNLEASLLGGTPVFEYTDNSNNKHNSSHILANTIFINKTDYGNGRLLPDRTLRSIYGHEAVHAVQYRSSGTAEIALRTITIPSYATFSDKTHLVLGADIGQGGFWLLSFPLAHENRPVEFVPERLTDNPSPLK